MIDKAQSNLPVFHKFGLEIIEIVVFLSSYD